MGFEMTQLKFPKTPEDHKLLEERVSLTPEEQGYLKDLHGRLIDQLNQCDIYNMVEFYKAELERTVGELGTGVKMKLEYTIAATYNTMGIITLEDHEPKERAEAIEEAIKWYQKADETAGFLINCEERANACLQAAYFRGQAGGQGAKKLLQEAAILAAELAMQCKGGIVVIGYEKPEPKPLMSPEELEAYADTRPEDPSLN